MSEAAKRWAAFSAKVRAGAIETGESGADTLAGIGVRPADHFSGREAMEFALNVQQVALSFACVEIDALHAKIDALSRQIAKGRRQ